MRIRVLALIVLALALTPGLAFAQTRAVEWDRWDAQITVRENDQLQIAETQEIRVTSGTIREGIRNWTTAVDVQNVFLIVNNGAPQQLTQNTSGQPGTYQVSTSGGQTTLNYFLPQPQETGKSFVAQINYTATSPTTGMVDWRVIPANHDFPVRSSTVRISFPEGQAPDPSLIRPSQDADVNASGNVVEIRSRGAIAPSQSFGIQVPYGEGVGAPSGAGSGGNVNPVNPDPVNPRTSPQLPPTEVELPGSSLLFILCILGLMLFFGGGNLLRSLLGGLGGGSYPGGSGQPGGGIFPSGRIGRPSNSERPSASGRGFRPSSGGNRSVGGNVGSDKDSGGGASFR